MRVVDLFCGCGGFSLGFDYLEDFELVYALDNWDVACKSYKANFPKVDVDCRDALEVKPSEIPRTDVIIGGPPCQEFSVTNTKFRNYEEPNLDLVNWFFSVVAYHKATFQTKFWIMENVPLLKKHIQGGNYRKDIFRMKDFGVPQIRKRLFAGNYETPRKEPTKIHFPAVCASEWKGVAKNMRRLADKFKRRCLIPEAKLVQTFPLDFIVLGKLKDQYIQIGNAVPPLFAYRLAEALVNPSQTKLVGKG